jgi:dipeptidyl aminopeptidase/acylaminoacyl peptidase
MDKYGSNQVNLTKTKKNESEPCWYPDGSKIAFQSTRNATSQIYIMNSDGSDPKRVTKLNYNNSFPKWSPDGKKILCTTVGSFGYKSSIINIDDANSDIDLPFHAFYTLDCFSKDNKKILGHLNHFGNSQSASDSLFIYNIDSRDLKIIPIDISDVLSAQFSINEDNILVEANHNTYIIGIDGENKLTIQNGISAKYSPKEDLILCVTNDERMAVGTIKTDGTGFINLTKD